MASTMRNRTFQGDIHGRISQFGSSLLRAGFGRPTARCLTDILFALLKCGHVHVTRLAEALQEPISTKKTWERLRRGLARAGVWERLTDAHLQNQTRQVRGMRYCVMDLSDVQKPYGKTAEGLALVRDGSAGGRNRIGCGWWWITAVMSDRNQLIPVHSELFSVNAEAADRQSENRKLVGIAERVHQVHPEAVMVLDRGGDRNTILEPFLHGNIPFVVRGMNQRNLRLRVDATKQTNIEIIAEKTRLTERYTARREGRHGRGKETVFDVGVRRVYLGDHALWLVVAKRRGAGRSWYLTNAAGTRAQIMKTAMEAYAERWRIEEFHRQIKQDFCFEQIAVRDYGSIKALGVLVMIAASFCTQLPEMLVRAVLAATGVLPRNRLSDIPRYQFYMVCRAVARLLAAAGGRPPPRQRLRSPHDTQLTLNLPPAA